VSLCENGRIIALEEKTEEKAHAGTLSVFIKKLMKEQNKHFRDIDAVAVGKGPGSYTGLRIGVSMAKGICFGSGIPLLSVGSLKILFKQAFLKAVENLSDVVKDTDTLIRPMIDARRMEVYTALFNISGEEIEPANARIIEDNSFINDLDKNRIIFAGTGMDKCRHLIKHPNAFFLESVYPSAIAMADLSEKAFNMGEFEDTAYFEPFYLKDFISTVPRKNLLS